MRLAAIRPQDVVRVDKRGRSFMAFVLAKGPDGLSIEPIEPGVSYRSATAREVVGHWARRGRRGEQEAKR